MSGLDDLTDGEPEPLPKDDRKEYQRRIAELEQQVESYEEQVRRHRKPRIRINPTTPRPEKQNDFVRVIIPDTHGCFIDQRAAAAFLADLQVLQPAEIIMIGDHLDCGGFLAEHHTLGFVPDADYSYDDDIDACNSLLDSVQSICPHARIDYLYGNHEERIEKYAIKQAIRDPGAAERLRQSISPEHVLNLKTRGINWCRSNKHYDGLPVPGTIKRGHCHFQHGYRHSKHAAAAHLADFGGNLVFGHIHRIQSTSARTVQSGVVSAWSVGCLCGLQPSYRNRATTDWAHGYGVQFCDGEDGSFMHVTVHIIDGVSFLKPFVEMAAS